MVHTDDRERKGREARKGKSVSGTDHGRRSTVGDYVGDIGGVSVVRVIEGALWSGKRHLLKASGGAALCPLSQKAALPQMNL